MISDLTYKYYFIFVFTISNTPCLSCQYPNEIRLWQNLFKDPSNPIDLFIQAMKFCYNFIFSHLPREIAARGMQTLVSSPTETHGTAPTAAIVLFVPINNEILLHLF